MSSTPSSSSSNFQSIFDVALSDYAKQTSIDLLTHPFAQSLQNCDSPERILDLLGEKAKQFQSYRDGNRKLIDCLKPVVQILHAVSNILGEASSIVPFQPTKAILVGVDVLLTAAIGISTSYDALVDLFECIGNFLNRLRIHTKIPFSASMSGITTKIMVEVLSVLSLATKQIKQGRLKKFAKKLLGESEIEDVLHRLDRLTLDEARMTGTETLQVVHGLVSNMKLIMDDGRTSMDDIRQALLTIQHITSEMNKMKRDQLQRDIRNWLSPPDPSKNYNIARDSHHDGTAEWFTRGVALEGWKTTGSLLWIHGKPGSGKSVLCSSIIDEIKMKCDRGLALMGYYYFDFKDVAKQAIRGLLTSLLSQFCAKSDPCYHILSDLYSENNAGSQQPDDGALAECLKKILILPDVPMRYIILDAIDECPNTSGFPTAREKVLKFLAKIIGLKLPNLRICALSRPEIDIRTFLEPLASLHISLHDEDGQRQDILDYINNVVHSDWKMLRWRPEDKQHVIDTLSRKADGMFRWVYCQLETLRRCLPTVISHALNDLPKSLDETYERTLLGIEKEKREFAHRLFQCLTVAIRPLRVDELAELLAIRFHSGQLPQYHMDWKLEDAQEAVLSTCSSLITVVNVDGCPVVQFCHFSVKEFLTSDRLANSTEDLSGFHVYPHSAHVILAQASLGVLLHLSDRVDKNSIKKYPFSQYAAQHWVDHGRFEDVSSRIQETMEHLFDLDNPSFATWIWIYDIDYPFRQHMFEDHPPRPAAAPLYYAALCGFRDLVERLIANHPGDINARGGNQGSAVIAALVKNNVEIALLLLGHGADVNTTDSSATTPWCRAIEYGRRATIELLLEHHADVNLAGGKTGETPLHVAAREGDLEITRVLLKHGAAVDAPDNYGRGPLMDASYWGHPETARLLIQSGAAVGTSANDGWTPLHSASQRGHLDIVQLLIKSGAAVNTPDNDNCTPLKSASCQGHLEIARLLIQSGAAVDTPDKNGGTPLMSVSHQGHLQIAQLLIQSGAAVNSRDEEDLTPLVLASKNGHLDIVRLLVQSGAVVDSRDKNGWTPLMFASNSGHPDVLQLLVQDGAAIDVQSTNFSTPLHLASTNGHLAVVTLLIELHADVDRRNKNQETSLHLATTHGQLEIVRFLIKFGSNPNIQDFNGSTPLHTAVHNGCLDILELILESGADVDLRNGKNQTALDVALVSRNHQVARYLANHMGVMDLPDRMDTTPLDDNPHNLVPGAAFASTGISKNANISGSLWKTSLHVASAEGNVEAVQSLLDTGADVNERNAWHETALYMAASKKQLEVVKLLIECGVEVDSPNKWGWTALHSVSFNGYRDIAELLLDHGANINPQNEDLLSPLHLASWNARTEVVRLLLERGADIHVRDIEGRTPYTLALRTGDRDVVRLLSANDGTRGSKRQ